MTSELSFRHEVLPDRAGFLLRSERPRSFRAFLAGLLGSRGARERFNAALAEVPLSAFAWECRPLSEQNLDAPLEMVAMESPALERAKPDPTPFLPFLRRAAEHAVTSFDNLGGDARLVVPVQAAADPCYTHLAVFVRGAPPGQQQAFWCEVARAVTTRLGEGRGPLWVSTAGLGVSWLHVRLDDRPKYYRYAPFRRI
jgi:hypothetical protein